MKGGKEEHRGGRGGSSSFALGRKKREIGVYVGVGCSVPVSPAGVSRSYV